MRVLPIPLALGLLQACLGHAAELGQPLPAPERSSLSAPLQLGAEHFQTLSPRAQAPSTAGHSAASGEAWVVNGQGIVGRSSLDVLVGQIDPAQVQAAVVAGGLPRVLEAVYNPNTRISRLHFASFADTVHARNLLVQRLPGASITVPVQYNRPRPK